MEHLDLRYMVADEVEYRKLDPSLTDRALRIIKQSDRMMELLDSIIDTAIMRAQKGE